jgi:hypothetical protein
LQFTFSRAAVFTAKQVSTPVGVKLVLPELLVPPNVKEPDVLPPFAPLVAAATGSLLPHPDKPKVVNAAMVTTTNAFREVFIDVFL